MVELVRRHGVREVVTDAAAHILDLRRSVGSPPRDRAGEGAGFNREGQQTGEFPEVKPRGALRTGRCSISSHP
jgi:hypothetical protein